MSKSTHHSRSAAAANLEDLRQEVDFLERRLLEMGERGDCAYEHALSRVYIVRLQESLRRLAEHTV